MCFAYLIRYMYSHHSTHSHWSCIHAGVPYMPSLVVQFKLFCSYAKLTIAIGVSYPTQSIS